MRAAVLRLAMLIVSICLAGCGTTREKLATEQLLMSDAVDRAVAHIDFSPLAGETVFLDTQYVRTLKTQGVVNADYIISSLRQQMVLAGCLLQDDRERADFVAEARVGTLGTDSNEVNFGVPASNSLSTAASIVGASAPIPALPEVSLARKTFDLAATKVAVFAYHRESKSPVWQSGLSVAKSRAQSNWILGAGPFQRGAIYDGTVFAGQKLPAFGMSSHDVESLEQAYRSPSVMSAELQSKVMNNLFAKEDDPAVRTAQKEERTDDTNPSDKPADAENSPPPAE